MCKAVDIVCDLLEDRKSAKDFFMSVPLEKTIDYYRSVVFLQGEEADEAFRIMREQGKAAVLDYLAQWDTGEGECSETSERGDADTTYLQEIGNDGRYLMSWNPHLGYIGLEFVKLRWPDEPSEK